MIKDYRAWALSLLICDLRLRSHLCDWPQVTDHTFVSLAMHCR